MANLQIPLPSYSLYCTYALSAQGDTFALRKREKTDEIFFFTFPSFPFICTAKPKTVVFHQTGPSLPPPYSSECELHPHTAFAHIFRRKKRENKCHSITGPTKPYLPRKTSSLLFLFLFAANGEEKRERRKKRSKNVMLFATYFIFPFRSHFPHLDKKTLLFKTLKGHKSLY